MIPYDIDPSLHSSERNSQSLDDGFSSHHVLNMATHPVEPEPLSPGPEPTSPNPTRLPVEPDFGPALPPVEPENPGVKPPTL